MRGAPTYSRSAACGAAATRPGVWRSRSTTVPIATGRHAFSTSSPGAARASFFLVGERAVQVPDAVRRMVGDGHEVASHGWSHRSLWLCGPRRTAEEIDGAHATLAELAGREPRHFRPPWGMVNAAMFGALRRRGERCVFWSLQPEGLRPVAAEDQVRHVLRRAHSGAIVDLHDAEGPWRAPERLVQALPAMIDGLRAAGYELTTVTELLEKPPASASA